MNVFTNELLYHSYKKIMCLYTRIINVRETCLDSYS